ncbi:MAG: histidine phosphatase family protein [Chloroflexi bacterium]|nr:histidine phosphatase family protein [Chloroflexota bacterium]MYK60897.1 histidine phosphatase family protein [Chloroflexota bacterium]
MSTLSRSNVFGTGPNPNRRNIILVRHGETQGNIGDRLQGQFDAPLTDKGVRQAQALSRRLANTDFNAVYASDLQRAVHTAQSILNNRSNIEIQLRPELRELHYGTYENTSWSVVQNEDPTFFKRFIEWETRPSAKYPGGESVTDLWQRVGNFANELLTNHSEEATILIVAHGGSLQALLAQFLALRITDQWHFHFDNTSVSIIKEHPMAPRVWQATLFNDTSHLESFNSHE